jgi:hypothetical protein
MWKDPIVQDVRNARKLLEKEFGLGEGAYLRHIYAQQKKSKTKLVSRSPKKPYVRKAA